MYNQPQVPGPYQQQMNQYQPPQPPQPQPPQPQPPQPQQQMNYNSQPQQQMNYNSQPQPQLYQSYQQSQVAYPQNPLNYPSQPTQYIYKFDSGLCSFCEDFETCLKTLCCCTCQTFKTKQELHGGSSSLCDCICQLFLCPLSYMGIWCCQGCYESRNRELLKTKINFINHDSETCKSIFCLPCVVCQHRREITTRKKNNQLH